MERRFRVAARLQKPLMIFDGDCNFCRSRIARWRKITGDAVDYLPFQDDSVSQRFPEIVDFRNSVQLIAPDGLVYHGAEAVFYSLATNPRRGWILWLYRNAPGVAPLSECAYRFVSSHRSFLSSLIRFFGSRPQCSECQK